MRHTGDDPLMHYGVLGMKWGVRKDGKPQGFQYGRKGRKAKKQRTPDQIARSNRRKATAKRVAKTAAVAAGSVAAAAGAVYAGRQIANRMDAKNLNTTIQQARKSIRRSSVGQDDLMKFAHDLMNKSSDVKVSNLKQPSSGGQFDKVLKDMFGPNAPKSGTSKPAPRNNEFDKVLKDMFGPGKTSTTARKDNMPSPSKKTSRPSVPSNVRSMEKLAPGISKAYEEMRANLVGPGSKAAADKYNQLAGKYYSEYYKVRENYVKEQNRR